MAAKGTLKDAVRTYILMLEARVRSCEAEAANWRARWDVAHAELALLEATQHQMTRGHSLTIAQPIRCRDCGWVGRTDPYAQEQA